LSFSRRSLADRQHAQSFETFFAELRLASQSEIVYLAKTGHRGDDLAAKGLRFFETPEPERCTEIVGLETERLPMDQSALSRSPTLLPHRHPGATGPLEQVLGKQTDYWCPMMEYRTRGYRDV
jgi:hypothetical protein